MILLWKDLKQEDRTIMKKLDQTAEEAMDTLDIADEDKVRYRKMLGL